MKELSIFVDESGDSGEVSDYYLITLVFHEQESPIATTVSRYITALRQRGLENAPMHLSPLMNGNDDFKNWTMGQRRGFLACFAVLIDHLPFRYITLSYKKDEFCGDDQQLMSRMKRDLTDALFDNLAYLQAFDSVRVYYDNGQSLVTKVIHDAIEYVLAKNAVIYRDARPDDYRLLQVADYACTLELAAIKYMAHEERPTDTRFLGNWKTFKRNYLRKLRKHAMK